MQKTQKYIKKIIFYKKMNKHKFISGGNIDEKKYNITKSTKNSKNFSQNNIDKTWKNNIKKILRKSTIDHLEKDDNIDNYKDVDFEILLEDLIEEFVEQYSKYNFNKLVFERMSVYDNDIEPVYVFSYDGNKDVLFYLKDYYRSEDGKTKLETKFVFEIIPKIFLRQNSEPTGIWCDLAPKIINTECKKYGSSYILWEAKIEFHWVGLAMIKICAS
jgi:hypothetical protein